MNPAPVFVTGGTGFIGTKLIRALLERGYVVHALVRATSQLSELRHSRVVTFPGDILDGASIRAAMKGCQYGFHLAAYARNWAADPQTFFRYNVEAARNVLEAAKEAQLGKLVFTSTIVTLGPTPRGIVGNEEIQRTGLKSSTVYEESKMEGETVALNFARAGLPVTIVNPTRVYGPGKLTEGNSVSLLIKLYHAGKFPFLLEGGRNVGNYAYVDDVVRGHLLALDHGRAGERYILGGENATLSRLFDLVDEGTGQKHRRIPLPGSVVLAYAWLEEQRARLFSGYPQITPGWVRTFLLEWAYSSEKAERELGYTVTPLREGIRQTLQWLEQT